jgi:hypothetical protein
MSVVGESTLHRLDPLAETLEGRILSEHRERWAGDARAHLNQAEELKIYGVRRVAAEKPNARHQPFLKE